MRTILVVEDERATLRKLDYWIEAAELDVQVLTEATFEGARKVISNTHIDLLVLDINLTHGEDELGIEIAEEYRKKYRYNPIIFHSVNVDYRYRSELQDRIGSVNYLPKNDETTQEIFLARLKYELDRLEETFTQIIHIRQKDQLIRLVANDILYFEKINGERNAKCFYYNHESREIEEISLPNITLKQIEKLPNAEQIIRCSGSYIVNPKMIKFVAISAQGMDLTLKYTDKRVPMSRNYYRKHQQLLEGILQ